MYGLVYTIGLGIILGLSLAGAPGPVNAIIATESRRSRLHGFSVGLGATSADFTYFLIMLFFSYLIPAALVNYLYVIGGFLLLYMAYSISKAKVSNRKPHGNYIVGYTIALLSPYNLSWWLTAGLFMLRTLSIYAVAGLFVGIFAWISLFAAAMFKLRKNIDSKIMRHISSAVLLLFGLFMLYHSALTLP